MREGIRKISSVVLRWRDGVLLKACNLYENVESKCCLFRFRLIWFFFYFFIFLFIFLFISSFYFLILIFLIFILFIFLLISYIFYFLIFFIFVFLSSYFLIFILLFSYFCLFCISFFFFVRLLVAWRKFPQFLQHCLSHVLWCFVYSTIDSKTELDCENMDHNDITTSLCILKALLNI